LPSASLTGLDPGLAFFLDGDVCQRHEICRNRRLHGIPPDEYPDTPENSADRHRLAMGLFGRQKTKKPRGQGLSGVALVPYRSV